MVSPGTIMVLVGVCAEIYPHMNNKEKSMAVKNLINRYKDTKNSQVLIPSAKSVITGHCEYPKGVYVLPTMH